MWTVNWYHKGAVGEMRFKNSSSVSISFWWDAGASWYTPAPASQSWMGWSPHICCGTPEIKILRKYAQKKHRWPRPWEQSSWEFPCRLPCWSSLHCKLALTPALLLPQYAPVAELSSGTVKKWVDKYRQTDWSTKIYFGYSCWLCRHIEKIFHVIFV